MFENNECIKINKILKYIKRHLFIYLKIINNNEIYNWIGLCLC